MKIATFNINNINKRLAEPHRLAAMPRGRMSCACRSSKATDADFPVSADCANAGYDAVWRGQKHRGMASRFSHAAPSRWKPARGLPGDPDDTQSRYIEAADQRDHCRLSLSAEWQPGSPVPKFDYKLRWFERLMEHAESFIASDVPVVLAGDYNVVPTELDIYAPESLRSMTRCFSRRVAECLPRVSLRRDGRTPSESCIRDERIYTFWDYMRNRWPRDAGLRLDHLSPQPRPARRA